MSNLRTDISWCASFGVIGLPTYCDLWQYLQLTIRTDKVNENIFCSSEDNGGDKCDGVGGGVTSMGFSCFKVCRRWWWQCKYYTMHWRWWWWCCYVNGAVVVIEMFCFWHLLRNIMILMVDGVAVSMIEMSMMIEMCHLRPLLRNSAWEGSLQSAWGTHVIVVIGVMVLVVALLVIRERALMTIVVTHEQHTLPMFLSM